MPIKKGPDNQVIVAIGIGDVMIANATHEGETVERCVTFHQRTGSRPVGEPLSQADLGFGSSFHAPVLIEFGNVESVDALLVVLIKTRATLAQEVERGNRELATRLVDAAHDGKPDPAAWKDLCDRYLRAMEGVWRPGAVCPAVQIEVRDLCYLAHAALVQQDRATALAHLRVAQATAKKAGLLMDYAKFDDPGTPTNINTFLRGGIMLLEAQERVAQS